MTRGKWLIMLVIILGLGLLLTGCGGKNEPAKNPAPQDQVAEQPKTEEPKVEEPKKEEPKAEEPKNEEPKVEEPKKEEPKVEEPKKEAPAPSGPPTLTVKHTSGAPYDTCANCHAGGNMLTSVKLPSNHGNLDGAFATCSSCHTLKFQ
jgi:outer membrane biosynthesis protein TonB